MNNDNGTIKFKYKFKFSDGVEKQFNIELDEQTLNLNGIKEKEYPEWTLLKNFRCPICPLNETRNKYCPIITNLLDVISFFKSSMSYEEVDLFIETRERNYMKHTSLQAALNPLVGLIMPTSGCPVMEKLKPMVRFHLPFASLDETNYRMISMYLFAQYFIYKEGGEPDWELKNLVRIYEDIRIVNKNFCEKLAELQLKDAAVNALITLDCFAFSIAYTIDKDNLESIKQLFKGYIEK